MLQCAMLVLICLNTEKGWFLKLYFNLVYWKMENVYVLYIYIYIYIYIYTYFLTYIYIYMVKSKILCPLTLHQIVLTKMLRSYKETIFKETVFCLDRILKRDKNIPIINLEAAWHNKTNLLFSTYTLAITKREMCVCVYELLRM